jgi:putative endopeptidase
MNYYKNFLLVFLSLGVLVSCSDKEVALEDPLITHCDSTANPAENFFYYANGAWFKQNPIPSTENSNGIFKTISDTINSQIKQICEKSAAESNLPAGSNKQKIGDFYAAGMDTVAIEKAGLSPLKAELKNIESIRDISTLLTSISHLQTIGCSPAFSFYVAQDEKMSTKYAISFNQGGLGLRDRDYYFNKDASTSNIRKEYVKHVTAIMVLMGEDKAQAQRSANTIMKLETELAKSSRKLEALRDPIKNYNKMGLGEFDKITPSIQWKSMLTAMGLKNVDTVNVHQPEFFSALDACVKNYSIDDWKTYLKWNLVDSYAGNLTKAFRDQNFKFYGTVMSGVTEQKPRWEGIVDETDGALGDLIGQIYVKEYLPKGAKEKLMEIGTNIRTVFASHIKKLDWMSEPTKVKAIHKLNSMTMKVGYPDKWKDLSKLKISRKSYCNNVMNANIWGYKDMISKYGKKVDKSEWGMQPHTYNAYYDPSNNEIVVPACNIIVPGFEGRMADDAILYSIIGGSTFGHEMTHGFDDQGSQFDEKGNLNNWWTAEDLKKFQAKTKLIVEQFNAYKVLGNKHVNGDATQGENIADLGGVVMGYEAFKKTKQYKSNQIISGLSPNKRFFLGYAYAWMVNINKESLASQIMTDVHSPAQFRINGPLSNMTEFYTTFGVKKGDKMYMDPAKRVVIW